MLEITRKYQITHFYFKFKFVKLISLFLRERVLKIFHSFNAKKVFLIGWMSKWNYFIERTPLKKVVTWQIISVSLISTKACKTTRFFSLKSKDTDRKFGSIYDTPFPGCRTKQTQPWVRQTLWSNKVTEWDSGQISVRTPIFNFSRRLMLFPYFPLLTAY